MSNACLCNINLTITEDTPIELKVEEGTFTEGTGERYKGPYTVVPEVTVQTLETKNKTMLENVTVKEIPRHEISNLYGTTLIIGGLRNGT